MRLFVSVHSYGWLDLTFDINRSFEVLANMLFGCVPEISGALRTTSRLGVAPTLCAIFRKLEIQMTWFTYETSPIDMGWESLRTVQETVAELVQRMHDATRSNDIDPSDLNIFLRSWEAAKDSATVKGWEGDFRQEPRVFWIPAETEFIYGFVFKQDNNGTTYVVAPVEMAWLESDF